MWRLRDGMTRFMYGRYGIDKLYYFLFALYVLLLIIGVFITDAIAYAVVYVLSAVVLVYAFFRIFSRNIEKRVAEGRRFDAVWSKVTSFFRLNRNRIRDRKTHVYRRCPSCKAVLRLPKVKGKHTAICPRCGSSLKVKI